MGFIQIIYLATTKEGNCVYKHTQKKKEINVRKKKQQQNKSVSRSRKKKNVEFVFMSLKWAKKAQYGLNHTKTEQKTD